jgi:hypothetical protein
MDDLANTELDSEEQNPTLENSESTVGRRDFLKLAAILTGSTLLMLSRCGGFEIPEMPPDQDLPPIPPNFKRFVLTRRETRSTGAVQVLAAFGSQCPDWQCTLLWVDQPEFEFYENVEEVLNAYTQDGLTELVWLD